MSALSELSDMARDYGLGMKYFLMVGIALVAMMLGLFLWGRVAPSESQSPVAVEAPAAPSASGAPTSY
jgi:hypothetical protein